MQIQEQKNQSSPLQYLSCLQQQFPVRGAVVAGSGTGAGAWMDLLQNQGERVLLVEADSERARSLERIFATRDNWHIEQRALAECEQNATFYHLSLRGESGLLNAEQLRDMWPNIRPTGETEVSCATLNLLCSQHELQPNWLIVDCLPALPILRGATDVISEVDVVVARRTARQSAGSNPPDDAEMLEDYLDEQGFVCLGIESERNPALGHAVYVRDYLCITKEFKAQIHKKDQELDQKTQQLEASGKESAELKQQLKARTQERDDLQGQLNEKIKAEEVALAEASKFKEAHAGLVQERDEVKRELTKLKEQFTQLEQQNKTADEKASEEQNKLNSKISSLKHNIDELSKENADLNKKQEQELLRHQAIEQELDRAEQQLKIIEELVLNNPRQADPEAG